MQSPEVVLPSRDAGMVKRQSGSDPTDTIARDNVTIEVPSRYRKVKPSS